ncbi:23S rRNA pseudouridine(1911/1915/1917) synthase RluD [Thermochromatium tepidum]|uniref:Pseudouridine synthase n=1 Tax=Thermochromatium tepidum ATCC 43061 TaxID=316276 RepID=A0A6I6E5D6_THETI|nr:23S rRNA pseudouridine(1911/1915/1917) synthase RluD [Thermochromatium tepidum]QGU31883.1 23S rRNA pseudouridine(1911/1915/1917) synthase RluD [Thermochromatium tepidum ATCC 43061]
MSSISTETVRRSLRVDPDLAGDRLDRVLARLLPEFSRGRLQRWIEAGQVLVDDRPCRVRDKVWGGESIRIEAELAAVDTHQPQAIALDLVYEDAHLLVINKPAGLVVHPAAGNPDGTLQNALLHRAPELSALPRAGIVHRLDKDTTGLMVVARTLQAHHALVEQLRRRIVHREYRALVLGTLVAGGRVEAPIGRHPTQRTKMAVVNNGRAAITHYRVLESYPGHTLLAVELETGRTHQIRVHMAHIHHPLVGDTTYGARPRPPRGCRPELAAALQGFPRQALHAIRLGLIHPVTGAEMLWEIPMAPDLAALLDLLRWKATDGIDHS